MRLVYAALAHLTVIGHLAFVAFVMLGGVLALRWPRVAWVHLPCAAWGALVEMAGWICPLTPLEQFFRARAGEQTYATSFLEHYLVPLLYPGGLTRTVQIGLGVAVVVLNGLVYGVAWRRKRSVPSARRA